MGVLRFVLAFILLLTNVCSQENCFWAWARQGKLTLGEAEELVAKGVSGVFWQVGELELEDEELVWRHRFMWPAVEGESALRVVPVVRIASNVGGPEEWTAEGFVERVRELGLEAEELQIDFDCPTGKLSKYAARLDTIRDALGENRLTTTALASWPLGGEGWEQLQGAVDGLYPMFYDMRVEQVGEFIPLFDAVGNYEWLGRWGSCEVEWFAGFPNFRRLSLYRDGRSRGHLREWRWREVIFNKALQSLESSEESVHVFEAIEECQIGRTGVKVGDLVVAREPNPGSLYFFRDKAIRRGASGIIFYELPTEGRATAGWSVESLEPGELKMEVAILENRLVLSNVGTRDIAPGFAPRGHQLELRYSKGSLRELIAGEFFEVQGGDGLVLPVSESVVLWFEDLRAGAQRQSGLIQFAPGADSSELEWRIGEGEWNYLGE